MHHADRARNQKTALPGGMALLAQSEGGNPLVVMARTSLGHRPVPSLPAQSDARMTYNCSIGLSQQTKYIEISNQRIGKRASFN